MSRGAGQHHHAGSRGQDISGEDTGVVTDILDRVLRLWTDPIDDRVDPVGDFRSCYTDPVLVNGVPLTAADLVNRARATQMAYSDLRVELVHRIETGNKLVIAFLMHGRHTGPVPSALGEVAPTGRRVAIRTTDVLTVRSGLIEDVWVIADEMDLLRQLGKVSGAR